MLHYSIFVLADNALLNISVKFHELKEGSPARTETISAIPRTKDIPVFHLPVLPACLSFSDRAVHEKQSENDE